MLTYFIIQLSNVGSFLAAFQSVDNMPGSFAAPPGRVVAPAFAIVLAASEGIPPLVPTLYTPYSDRKNCSPVTLRIPAH